MQTSANGPNRQHKSAVLTEKVRVGLPPKYQNLRNRLESPVADCSMLAYIFGGITNNQH